VLDVDTHRGVRVEPHPVRWWRGSAGEELGVAGVGEVVAERFGELAELGGGGGVEEGVELWEVVGGQGDALVAAPEVHQRRSTPPTRSPPCTDTHDRRGAAALAHRIVVLDHGRIRADGTTADVLNDPAVATHIGGDSLLDDALAAHLHDRPESTLDTD
jgi:hypothetical protein